MSNTPKKTIIVSAGPAATGKNTFSTGVLLNLNNGKKGGVAIELLMVMEKKEGRTFQRISLAGTNFISYLNGLPPAVAVVIKKLRDDALVEHLVRNGFAWLKDAEKPFEHLDDRHFPFLHTYVSGILQELKPLAPAIERLFYLPEGVAFASHSVRPAAISPFVPSLQFKVEKEGGRVGMRCSITINHNSFPLEDFQQVPFFLKSGNEFFLLKKEDEEVLKKYKEEWQRVPELGQPRYLETIVRPLAEKYPVDMEAVIRTEVVDMPAQGRVYVSELNENFLLIKPKWVYSDQEVEGEYTEEERIEEDDKVFVVVRRREEEAVLTEAIRDLHSKFSGQSNGYFYLNFKEALEKSWFLRFYQKMQQLDIPVLGMNKLRKFKYNTNVPKLELTAGKSIDWFDLTIRVSYGDQVVPLHELRKAILGRQDFILLADGSLGMLPKEWIEQYSLLLKMGQVKEGVLKLAKAHWGLVEENLSGGTVEDGLRQELELKKQRLLGIGEVKERAVPAGIQARLRDYQQAGFQWMCLLDEMGWGGCLADDMGLGKTLQTITFLQYLVNQYPDETHLVVCPTSLLYNWEGELKKFAPGLDWHIHYGADRVLDEDTFSRAHIIITSYGMVRNDIQHFTSREFGYIILDESQAIKNPASQVRKAVQQLISRNRLALSGTPVQNNTFDLYAQMDFLNPGMLGSQDFFRMEFATPVDKNGDKEAAARLRKLVYPFILRRTKEQVAGDLPDKTEMILWCEMGVEQRKIYDSFKEHYRESILEHIAEDGMGRSSFYILEGLTKLRQICDSPAILREQEPYPNASAKLDELIREIEENTGHHKALVFSQFTSMLELIRGALAERGIPYLYLDGSISAEERKRSVQQFQEEEDTRVFLISLKAGGVGLTLTAADYVYLVDPWWNPAAEQQAIDRSHRIGQVKKVFAYRMICKDTVEEKILQLQERKRQLTADLVGDEGGFVKQLTQEDVAYLFS
ncbi:MAG: DEAD/DEAH box helicase [Chitinophagaceae bacterium]|nr:DEAD/DEAH box helicase [Chitinophagaceae bacterium]